MTNTDHTTPETPNRNPTPANDVASAPIAPGFAPRAYTGGCACGAVRYRVTLDLSAGTSRCNCSMCAKASLWSAMARPEAFELLSGADALVDFQRGGRFSHFVFCRTCGVRSFSRGDAPWMGGAYVAVQVSCLDVEEAELAGVVVRHFDGRHDDWQSPRLERFAPAAERLRPAG